MEDMKDTVIIMKKKMIKIIIIKIEKSIKRKKIKTGVKMNLKILKKVLKRVEKIQMN